MVQYDEPEIKSQSLFYWKLLCNYKRVDEILTKFGITILILLETPLQFLKCLLVTQKIFHHNPYFTGNSFAIKQAQKSCFMEFKSQSLFYWKLLCNLKKSTLSIGQMKSQSLFYWKLLCNVGYKKINLNNIKITILILLETPLQ